MISFHQLGFKGPKEAEFWIEELCLGGRFGLVVVPHYDGKHLSKVEGNRFNITT